MIFPKSGGTSESKEKASEKRLIGEFALIQFLYSFLPILPVDGWGTYDSGTLYNVMFSNKKRAAIIQSISFLKWGEHVDTQGNLVGKLETIEIHNHSRRDKNTAKTLVETHI